MVTALVSRFKWLICLATTLSIASAAAGVGIIMVLTEEIDRLAEGGSGATQSFPLFLAAIVVLVSFGLASEYILTKLSASVVFELRSTMVRRILATAYERIEQIGGHRIFATLTEDIANIAEGLMMLPKLIYNAFTVVLCLVYLCYSSWQLFLVVFGLIVATVAVVQIFLAVGMRYQGELRERNDDMYSGMRSLVDGGKELSSNAERKRFFYSNVMSPVFDGMRKATMKAALTYILLNTWTRALVFCVIAAIVYGSQLFAGIPVGVVVGFVLVALYMVDPLEEMVDAAENVGNYKVALNKIERLALIGQEAFALVKPDFAGGPTNWKTLRTEQLQYRYQRPPDDGYAFSVGPISMELKRGEVVFLTGGNGSGKSTLAKLLTGLYTPSLGKIFLDDNLVGEDVDLEWYRANFSVIFSDFFLFDQVLNKRGELAEDTQIAERLKRLRLEKQVTSKGGVLSSVDVSHGQRKRLALLMSYLEDAAVCVYDEWAADQDPQFRNYFYVELLPELKSLGKTVIVISHDDRYFHLADHLLKLENGELAEDSLATHLSGSAMQARKVSL